MAGTKSDQTADALVVRAKAGDREAFDELVRRYRTRIVALTLHITGNEGDAEDITQDVFWKAFRALDSFEGRSHFFTWVYRMAVNRSINAKRDRQRRNETGMDDPRVERALAVDAAGDPARAAELRQTYTRLLIALDKLPAEMRTSVILVTLQGMSHAEAGVVQACSAGTVAWRIHEARKRLRKAMLPAKPPRVPLPRHAPLSRELLALLQLWGMPAPAQ